LVAAMLVVAGNAAAQQLLDWTADEVRAVGLHGPWPPPPAHDPSNRVSGNTAAIVLGRHLFDEPRLSPSRQVSCGDCHSLVGNGAMAACAARVGRARASHA
jgi:cytochrome c peroxidase